MPRISQLTQDFAERFAFEPSRVAQIAKALRMDGLIQSGPRGVNAPDASPLDAARLLIGMMLRVKNHEVSDGVRLFGRFELWDRADPKHGAAVACEDMLVKVLEICGHEDEPSNAERQFRFIINRDLAIAKVIVSTWAGDDHPMAEDDEFDGFNHFEFRYLHPEFGQSVIERKASPELRKAWRLYRSGFHEEPMLSNEDLLEIGQVIAGHTPPLEASE